MVDYAFMATFAAAVLGCVVLGIDRARLLRETAQGAERIRALEAMAYVDELTQAGNRRLFDEQLATLVAHTLRAGESLGLLVVDLNGLKATNDTRGHLVGDRVIRALAGALKDSVRPTDHVCRVGGDEFCVLLPACTAFGLCVVIGRIIRNLEATNVIDGSAHIPVRVSIGGTTLSVRDGRAHVGDLDVGGTSSRSSLAHAARIFVETGDLALYAAKARKSEEEMPYTLR